LIRSLTRARRASNVRKISLRVDRLEAREVLSTIGPLPIADSAAALQVAHPMFALSPDSGNGPGGGYTPAQITAAYGFNSISFNGAPGTGAGETIAIVDAYNDPNIVPDLATFDSEFGLPSANLSVVNETGGSSLPAADSTGGWELEESLDVEWAHAIAPGAKIFLVEASSSSDSDLLAGVNTASTNLGANVVSMSWGGSEFSGETSYDSDFEHTGIVYTASSGDSGAPISWPAASPNVLAVGGTSLTVNGTTYGGETGWSGSGGGPSAYYAQPSYQSGVVTQTTKRANPDVAYNADPNDGFSVYDSVPYSGTTYDWLSVGGTSAGSPQWAALAAVADQGRAVYGLPAINASSSQEIQTTLYKNTSDFHDITSGTSTGSPHYSAGTGYDYVTGIGSPIANLVVQSLDGTGTTQSPDHLVVSGATTDVAGGSYSLTVTAETSAGAVDPSYAGTVKLTSSDAQAVLPAAVTFNASDAGKYTFTVTLKTAGTQSITATDTTTGAASATESGIVVSPAAASQFIISGLPSSSNVGASDSFTIIAKDPYGNVATGYTGTVVFTSSDAAAGLPASHTFTTANQGVYSSSVTFNTAGTQTLTASDGSLSVTSSGVVVSPSGTITLTASAASASQINLSWNGIAGATGYIVQESANGSTGWTQIASTASNVTTYSNTGLAAGTTYYYRIQATGGNGSGYSNVASATTTGSASGGSVSLWPNSYAPSENYYSSGSYELGVKIETSVAGQVTALRFYQGPYMGGYTHVGHLWSSSGTLLATATFTTQNGQGWEQVSLSSPVTIAANTIYIVSFSTGGGYFDFNSTSFASAGVTNGPLQALANGVSGGDGVYGRSGKFPTTSGDGDNFFADLVFSPSSSPSALVGSTGQSQSGSSGLAGVPLSLSIGGTTASDDSTSGTTSTTTPKVQVNTVGSWPGRRVASEDSTPSIGRNRFGSFFGI
jgi:Domain of unknown function (DUF4082)